MSKSDVTQEQARTMIDRVAQELGLLVADTSGFIKVQGATSKHRIYVQRSRTLNRVDTTLPIPADDPAYKGLSAPNGSIACHVQPDLVQLERALRMLADPAFGTQTPNKPRPFAGSKAPAARKPQPLVEPVDEARLAPIPEGGDLKTRLAKIKEGARRGRIQRIIDNPEKYGAMSEAEAEELVDSKVSLEDFAENRKGQATVELMDLQAETGVQLDMN